MKDEQTRAARGMQERCYDRDPRTQTRCMLITSHEGSHRWWDVVSVANPDWEGGFKRREWESGRPSSAVLRTPGGGAA